jgi:hypothetical protein
MRPTPPTMSIAGRMIEAWAAKSPAGIPRAHDD